MLSDSITLGEIFFCALDLETTGANPALHRLIEVGMVSFTLEGIIDQYSSFVDPEMPIMPRATEIHGITSVDLAGAPTVTDIMGEVLSFLEGKVLVIHNTHFDLSFIMKACREASIPMPEFIAVDTVVLARRAFPELENHRLDTLCRHLGISLEHHQALSDAAACMEVFRRSLESLKLKGSHRLKDLWSFHENPVCLADIKSLWPGKGSIDGIKEGKAVIIHYRDSHGMVTERKIIPHEVIQYGKKKYIRAFCYLREEDRYFRESRIQKILKPSPFLSQ